MKNIKIKKLKKLMIIFLIIALLISSYLIYCFGFKRFKYEKDGERTYKGVNYYYCPSLSLHCPDYKQLKRVSFSADWRFPLFIITHYALERDNPEIIICPKGHDVYFRNDVDYQNISFAAYLFDTKNDIFIGNYSLSDLLNGKAEEQYEREQFTYVIFLYSEDALGIYTYLDIIKKDKYYLLFDDETYLASDLIIDKINEMIEW
mgnify:CR=1 FL=1